MPINYKTGGKTKDKIEKNIRNNLKQLEPVIENLRNIRRRQDGSYLEPSSFINTVFDEKNIKKVLQTKDKLVKNNLKYVVVIGIGGSDLGAKGVYDSLYGAFDSLTPKRFPKIIFLDTIDPKKFDYVKNLLNNVSPKEIIINVISKSGKTLETKTLFKDFTKTFPQFKNRIVVTTQKNSPLFDYVKQKKEKDSTIKLLTIPKNVGGRYSFFTSVGMFPLACVNIDITKLLAGGMEATKDCLSINPNNPSLVTSAFLYNNYSNGTDIHELFVFEPQLESMGEWYEQLISESLGKDGKGITPITLVGSTDLHSEAQLDIGGTQDKMVTFVQSNDSRSAEKDAIYKASVEMYKKDNIPVIELEFDQINLKNLGYFMQHKMIEVVYLSKLMNINPFNQPDIEEYKENAKKLL